MNGSDEKREASAPAAPSLTSQEPTTEMGAPFASAELSVADDHSEFVQEPFGALPDPPTPMHSSFGGEKMQTKWSGSLDATVTAAAYTSDIAAIWYFPAMITAHSSVFILQYLCSFVLVGLPLLYMEMSLGQFTSAPTPARLFLHMTPLFSGVGPAMLFLLMQKFVIASVHLSTLLMLLYQSFIAIASPPAFSTCSTDGGPSVCFDPFLISKCRWQRWNVSADCLQLMAASLYSDQTHVRHTPVLFYVSENIIQLPFLADSFTVKYWHSMLALFLVWLVMVALIFGGHRVIGHVAYACTGMTLLFTVYFFIRASFLSDDCLSELWRALCTGADWKTLYQPGAWMDSVTLVLLSLNLGKGGHIALASHCEFTRRFPRDVLLVAAFSLLITLALCWTVLVFGLHYSELMYVDSPWNRLLLWGDHGGSGSLTVIPEVVSKSAAGGLESAIYFLGMFALVFYGVLVPVMIVFDSLTDRFPSLESTPLRRLCAISTFAALFILASTVFYLEGGMYQLLLLDRALTVDTMLVALVQTVTVAHVYGLRRFITNIRTMVGGSGPISPFWWICWLGITPLMILGAFGTSIYLASSHSLWVAAYPIPIELRVFGWVVCIAIGLWIPCAALYHAYRRYRNKDSLRQLLQPTSNFGPLSASDRAAAARQERALRVR